MNFWVLSSVKMRLSTTCYLSLIHQLFIVASTEMVLQNSTSNYGVINEERISGIHRNNLKIDEFISNVAPQVALTYRKLSDERRENDRENKLFSKYTILPTFSEYSSVAPNLVHNSRGIYPYRINNSAENYRFLEYSRVYYEYNKNKYYNKHSQQYNPEVNYLTGLHKITEDKYGSGNRILRAVSLPLHLTPQSTLPALTPTSHLNQWPLTPFQESQQVQGIESPRGVQNEVPNLENSAIVVAAPTLPVGNLLLTSTIDDDRQPFTTGKNISIVSNSVFC